MFNGKLNQEIRSREIEIKIHNNGREVALIPNGEYCHKFTKSGRSKNTELIKKLKSSYDSKDVSVELDEETGRITGLDKTISDRLQVEHERKIKNMESHCGSDSRCAVPRVGRNTRNF